MRISIDRIGYDPSFSIYDTDDSKKIISSIIKELDLDDVGVGGTNELSLDPDKYLPPFWNSDNDILKMIGLVWGLGKYEFEVAAPDERAFHKYNGSTFDIDDAHNPGEMEGSTTYSLPYWMGRYYNLLGD